MSTNIQIAMTIKQQIGGNKTFMMLGVKHPVAVENGLAFKVKRNAKGVNYVEIKLNALDLYDVRYCFISARGIKDIAKDENIYSDMLINSIETNTGLYTKLF